jgi:hypothetical protein
MVDDTEKVEELAIALLFLTAFEEHRAMRAWKGIAWDVSSAVKSCLKSILVGLD